MSIETIAFQSAQALPQGILLNTQADKFNSMVIGWGHVGTIWNQLTFTVYVRQSRYTLGQLDRTGVFTVSTPRPGERLSPEVMKVCGSQSGRDVDKAPLFTLRPGRSIAVPAILEYPLTLECEVLYRQDQALEQIPEALRQRFYGGANDGDFHTAYIARIVDGYIVE